jgi:aspartate racemase
LSFAQQRLWVLHQIEPESPAYNVPKALRLSGQLDVDALQRSLNAVISRHEVLRTRFEYDDVDGHATQAVTDEARLDLPVLDISHLKETDRHHEVLRLAHEQLAEPFDFSQPPLIRAALVRCADQDHILLLAVHHIVFDGWSIHVLLRELAAFYTSSISNSVATLQPLTIQYADFACWQRQWLQGKVLEDHLSYWRERLSGTLPMLELPTDHPRPVVQTFNGAGQTTLMPQQLLAKLKSLSNKHSVTLFMTLLAAFKVLLYRYTGQEDVIVGTPIAGRNLVETENLIGFFVNTLTMRTDLGGDPSFTELLRRVRDRALEAYDHQDLPFEKLVEEIQPERSLSHSPFFQVMFQLRNLPRQSLKVPGLMIEEFEFDSRIAKFDISLSTREVAEGLKAELVYNADLFDADTITQVLEHYQNLLEGIVADPERRISLQPLLSEAELHRQLVNWNNVATDYPRNSSIQQLFEEQAENTPHSVAVAFEDQTLTYAQLNARANQVAHYLRAQGVAAETLVGISIERSLEMIVALLGILKAGGSYLPLDGSYPRERLVFMFNEAQPPLLLSSETHAEKFAGYSGQLIILNQKLWEKESQENLRTNMSPENLAYVMYTSASTGKPKGVCVTHRGVVRLVRNTNYADLSRDQVFLQLSPISFDVSTFEIWGSLLNGARLALMPPGLPSLAEIGNAIRGYRVSTLWLTAGLFQLMVDEQLDDLAKLRQLLAGGDVLSAGHVKKFLRNATSSKLTNGYGPTENTTFTCCYTATDADQFESNVPIGRPISNTQVYILDKNLQPLPVGAYGELHAGGDGLARCYLNNPELTAEKFIANPFSKNSDDRLYKTGDIARYRRDGTIEFVGRVDRQLKVRGFRVEPGEIESVLLEHPGVKEALVISPRDEMRGHHKRSPGGVQVGSSRLVAYVVSRNRKEDIVAMLQSFLKSKLPDYMIPAAIVRLDSFPLTPIGKINREALPAPNFTDSASSFAPPRTEIEERLLNIWQEILGNSQIGIHDNFFELGGHSLLAIQLLSRLRASFQVELSFRVLFDAPTVASLAQLLPGPLEPAEVALQRPGSFLVPVQPSGWRKPLFLLPGEGGEAELLGCSKLARYVGLDQPTYGVTAPTTTEDGLQLDVRGMAARCVRELRSFQPKGPYSLMGYCIGGIIAFEIAQQLKSDNQQVGPLILIDTLYPASALPPHLRRVDRYLISHFLNRARIHLGTLSNQTGGQGLGYMFGRVKTIGRMLESRYSATELVGNVGQAGNHGYLKAVADYRAEIYHGKIVLMVTEEIYRTNPTMGWSELAHGGLEIYQIAGDHLTCIKEQADSTAKLIRSCLG